MIGRVHEIAVSESQPKLADNLNFEWILEDEDINDMLDDEDEVDVDELLQEQKRLQLLIIELDESQDIDNDDEQDELDETDDDDKVVEKGLEHENKPEDITMEDTSVGEIDDEAPEIDVKKILLVEVINEKETDIIGQEVAIQEISGIELDDNEAIIVDKDEEELPD